MGPLFREGNFVFPRNPGKSVTWAATYGTKPGLFLFLSSWKLCSIFLEGDPLGQFGISQVGDEWRIFSRKTLDREHTAKYLLRITASDGKFQASVLVEIFVLDINDNSPQCSQVRAG